MHLEGNIHPHWKNFNSIKEMGLGSTQWLKYSICPKWVLTRGGQLIPDGRIMWLWGPRSGPSRCGGPWPRGAIIFLGGAAMELACIRAILERTASQPSSPACKGKERRATHDQLHQLFNYQFEMIWISCHWHSICLATHQWQHPEWHKTSS